MTPSDQPSNSATAKPVLRDVAWCGWRWRVPQAWRPFEVKGQQQKGTFGMGCDGQVRMVLRWARVTRLGYKPQKLVRRQLLRGLPRRQGRKYADAIESFDNASISPMSRVTFDDRKVTRCVGHSKRSRRMVEVVYFHGSAAENTLVGKHLFDSITDQPADGPVRWAFFDVSFIAPPSLTYVKSTLNVGDMRVLLSGKLGRRWPVSSAVVRQLYPATIALGHQPIEKWMTKLINEQQREYRLSRAARRRKDKYDAFETPLGNALRCDIKMRGPLRPFRWRTPRIGRIWLIHDPDVNRLIMLQATTPAALLDTTLQTLMDDLHWARLGGE